MITQRTPRTTKAEQHHPPTVVVPQQDDEQYSQDVKVTRNRDTVAAPAPRSISSTRIAAYEQLEVFNLLNHSVWIFDYIEKRMRWGNEPALELWNAESLQEFQERNFHDISTASCKRFEEWLSRIQAGDHHFHEQWTLYPKGRAKTVHLSVSGIKLSSNQKHYCFLLEATPHLHTDLLHQNLRSVEMLRHLPMAVCQFDMEGRVVFQNPEATILLSPQEENSSTSNSSSSSCSSVEEEDSDQSSSSSSSLNLDSQYSMKSMASDGNKCDNNNSCCSSSKSMNCSSSPQVVVDRELDTKKKRKHSNESGHDTTTTPIPLDKPPKSSKQTQSQAASRHGASLVSRFVDAEVGRKVLQELQTNVKHNQGTVDDLNHILNLEAMLHTHQGPRWSAIQLRPGRDPVTGDPVILFSARDKSDAVKARQEREAREQKSEFLAIMAHEIRTPLHQVTGFIDLLDQTQLNTEQRSYIKLLKSSAQGLMTVISDVLDYSKLEAGKMKLEKIPYEPFSVVEGSMEVVRTSCEEKGIRLDLGWDKAIPFKLLGDPNRLRQVLLNLLSNSVKFTQKGGDIHVQVTTIEEEEFSTQQQPQQQPELPSKESSSFSSKPRPMVKFVVRDTGVGIAEEHLSMIFNNYYQGNVSVARTHGGTGLGLSICKLLVMKMGGTIGVSSQLHKGSSFWVCLPADVPQEGPENGADGTVQDEDPAEQVQLNILVAEDNNVNQKLVKRMLEGMGHRATIVANGVEAIERVESTKGRGVDLVLMDIQMPVMDGLEATRRLRTMGYVSLPIFGLTASVARSDYRELGFDDWLPKPIPRKDLNLKLRQLKKQNGHLPSVIERQ